MTRTEFEARQRHIIHTDMKQVQNGAQQAYALVSELQQVLSDIRSAYPEPSRHCGITATEYAYFDRVTDLLLATEKYMNG